MILLLLSDSANIARAVVTFTNHGRYIAGLDFVSGLATTKHEGHSAVS